MYTAWVSSWKTTSYRIPASFLYADDLDEAIQDHLGSLIEAERKQDRLLSDKKKHESEAAQLAKEAKERETYQRLKEKFGDA